MIGTEPTLIEEYVNTGQVKMIFWPITDFGPNSLDAAASVTCAGQQDPDLFWALHDAYFTNFGRTSSGGRDYHVSSAVAVGADQAAFEACFDGGEAHQLVVQLDDARRRQGIRNRPSFDINGTILFGALPADVFRQTFDALLP